MISAAERSSAPPAIVVGLDCITGLQTARILARRQLPVIGIARQRSHFACRTRACDQVLCADTAGNQLIETLEQLGPRLEHKGVLFPCTDMSVLQISRQRDRLRPWFHVVLPPAGVIEMLMDKVKFYEFAREAGLMIPQTFVLRDRSDAEHAVTQLSYPCILKPPVKTAKWEQNTNIKAYKVSSAKQCLELYDRCCNWSDVLIVQQWVEGSEASLYSFNGYFDASSKPVATFIARKIRQWPPQTGTSCLGEECRNDEVLRESLRLFQSVGFHGLAYVEIKRDERTGEHFIIEPNVGRPTGRSAIAEAGGVELLYSKYCDTVSRPLPQNRQQEYHGVKWIYWRQDFRSALHYWRKGELTLKQWWRSLRGRKTNAVFSWSDPGPFLADVSKVLRQFVSNISWRRRAANTNDSSPEAESESRTVLAKSPHSSSRTPGMGTSGRRAVGQISDG